MPDLTTLTALKDRLKIPSDNNDADTVLSALITQTSDEFHSACNRASFFITAYSEARDGQGGAVMLLANDPVVAVTRVIVNGTPIPSSASGGPGWACDRSTLKLVAYSFVRGMGNVQVDYTAGCGDQLAALPQSIQRAVLDWCARRYKMQPADGVTSRRLGDGEVINYAADDMPPSVRRVVEQFKRRVPGY